MPEKQTRFLTGPAITFTFTNEKEQLHLMHYLAELALLEVQMLQYTSRAQQDTRYEQCCAVRTLRVHFNLRPSHIAAAAALLSHPLRS